MISHRTSSIDFPSSIEFEDSSISFSGHTSTITNLIELPFNRIASASYDHTIKVWNFITGICEKTLTDHVECVWALAMLSNAMFASGSGDKTIKVWDSITGTCTMTLFETAQVMALTEISENIIASGCWDKSIKIWNLANQRCIKRFQEHLGAIRALVPISKIYLASGSNDASIIIWNINNEDMSTLTGHTGFVTSLIRLPDDKLASGSRDCSIKIWDCALGSCEKSLIGHSGAICSLSILHDGYFASGSEDKTIRIWNHLIQSCLYMLEVHTSSITALQVLSNGNLISGSSDKSIKILNVFKCSMSNFLDCEVIMREYMQLVEIYEQHHRPSDYRAFLEHPDVARLKETLGSELASIFLCMIHYECEIEESFLQRLIRYKTESRLRDFEAAIIELARIGFRLTSVFLDDVCAKSGKDKTFLLSVRLMHVAKLAGFSFELNNRLPDNVFKMIKTNRIALYEKLLEKSALDIHVLKNSSLSDMPKNQKELNTSVDVYYYASLCQCTALLNAPSEHQMNVISIASKFQYSHLPIVLKKLYETGRLTKETFFLACKVSQGVEYLFRVIILLESLSIDPNNFAHWILSLKKDFSKMNEFYEILTFIQRDQLIIIDESHVQTMISLADQLHVVLESLRHLELRSALTPESFLWVMYFYEEGSPNSVASNNKTDSPLSRGLFSKKTIVKRYDFEVGAVIFALSEVGLLEQSLEKMSRYLTSAVADFILQMFHMGELTQKSLDLADQINFEKVVLKKIVELAGFHSGLPDVLPPVYVYEYLDCMILLGNYSGSLSPVINQLLSNEALILKSSLTFLKVGQAMSIAESLVLIEEAQTGGSAFLLKEKLFCKLLGWPIQVAEMFTQCAMEAQFFFQSLQSLKKQGVDIIPDGESSFLLNELCQSNDLLLDGKIIIELFAAKALNQEVWHFLSEMKMSSLQKNFLILTVVRLGERVNIDTLSLILFAKNSALALQIFTLLESERISVAQYWGAIMQHKHAILLCYGIIELHKNGYLTYDNFLKITQAQQPDLAAKALSVLLRSGIALEECWNEFTEVEDPDVKASKFIDFIDPLKRQEDLPFELRQVISHHAQPQLAKKNAAVLLTISELSNLQRLHILTHEESDAIVQALRQLSELTVLNDQLIEAIIEDNDMIEPFKKYFALSSPSENLFSQLCRANSIREAEDLIKREQIMSKLMLDYPDVAALLLNIFATSSVHQHQWATALALLESVDEINAISVANLQQSSYPEKIAVAIVALKKSGFYTEHYFNRAVRREERLPGVYNALRYLAEEGKLTRDLFNFVILNSSYDAIRAANVLLKMTDVRRVHLDWLAMYSPTYEYHGNAALDIIDKLERHGCLNRFWIEKLIQQNADRLEDIGCYLSGVPDQILNESILTKIFAHAGQCFYSRDEEEPAEYHSPFEAFSEDCSLLTQEVIELILTRPSYQYWGESVYKSMSSLKKAGLFCPEIIKICTTTGLVEAIITLSKENQWNEMNREIIIASQTPDANAQLIVYLAKIHKYSAETANLLLRQLQLSSLIDNTKQRSSIHSTYFSKLFQKLIDKNPALPESTLQHLLSVDINWLTIGMILENMEDKLIPDAQLCSIASANQHYLYTYVNYMEPSCRKKLKLSDIIKLCDYEFYLNKPELLAIISKASSKEKKSTSVDTERMQNFLIDIWRGCERGNQTEIHQSVLSYSEGVVKSVGQTSSLRL